MRQEMIILGNKALNHLRNLYKLNPTGLEIKASTGLPDESKYWNSPKCVWLAMCRLFSDEHEQRRARM
jgi:hypothetical protein